MGHAERITGVVLAGGRARRMHGCDKGLIELAGRPLAAYVVDALADQVQRVLINANRNRERYAALHCPVCPDEPRDYRGPLAGMAAGMRAADTPYILTVPCDSPLPSRQLAARLYAALEAAGARAAMAHDGKRCQPLHALLDRSLEEALRAAIDGGERRPEPWLRAQGAVEVDFSDCPEMFLNLNDPDSLERLVADHGGHGTAGIRQPSCQDPDAAPGTLSVETARARILDALTPLEDTQIVALREALDRVLAAPVTAAVDVPSGTNSAMDGYALRHVDLAGGRADLAVAGTAYAGHPHAASLEPGTCVRIMTGALMPQGADTVVIQEHARQRGGRVRIDADVQAGDNVRGAGEDIRRGETALEAGRRLGAAELGLLASLGVAAVTVRRPLKVVVLSTGDELVPVGTPLTPGLIYDSNRYTLHGMLHRPCTLVIDLGVVPDRVPELRAALKRAARAGDVIVSSGGVSVGEADLMRELLAELGSVHFWKVAMKPGRPLAFGRIDEAWFFGLPGNPVSVMVTLQQLVAPALARLRGERPARPLRLKAVCTSGLRKRAGRTEYQRGVLEPGEGTAAYTVRRTGAQGSGILRSMSEANCFIVLPAHVAEVTPGSIVEVEPFATHLHVRETPARTSLPGSETG